MHSEVAENPAWLGSLDGPDLLAAASEQIGLTDFGDDDFVEPMNIFLSSVRSEGALTEEGYAGVGLDVVRMLTNRLLHRADQLANPEISAEDVSDPTVIVGIPRTGTTKLQRVLSREPALQSLPLWKAMSPAPLPGSEKAQPDPRIALAQQASDLMFALFPDVMAGHPMRPEEPEEEILLQQMTFRARGTGLMYRVPSYVSWLDGQPMDRSYGYLADLLRYLQWQDGGRRGRSWLLKSPPHLGRIDCLMETFSAALVLRAHRDPAVAVPSLCRLMLAMRPSRGAGTVDRAELGSHMLEFCATEWEQHLRAADTVPEEQLIDVYYEDIVSDLHSVVETIYQRRGVDLSAQVVTEMRRWQSANPIHADGEFRYSLEQFGLVKEQIHERFANYLELFPRARTT